MADFESELTALFETGEDDRLGERLTHAAIAQIEREDRRRQLVLTVGVVAGLTVCVSTLVGSGVLNEVGTMGAKVFAAMPRAMDQPLALAAAAVMFAAYAAATLRPGRAL